MPQIPQSQFIRPTSVTVFRRDPAGLGLVQAFLVTGTATPSDARARFDMTESEVETHTFTPVRERMEKGIAATIATIEDPVSFTVTGVLTASPLGYINLAFGLFGSIVRRDISEYRRFLAMGKAREPVIVVAREGSWPSMAITSIVRSKVPSDGNSVRVAVSFEECRIVSPAGVIELVDLESLAVGAGSSSDMGTQSANTPNLPADIAAGGLG